MSLATCRGCARVVCTDDDTGFYDSELRLCESCREHDCVQCYVCDAWCTGDATLQVEPGDWQPVCDACHGDTLAEGRRAATEHAHEYQRELRRDEAERLYAAADALRKSQQENRP